MSGTKRTLKWSQTLLKLKPDHGWRAKPGYKIFVADRFVPVWDEVLRLLTLGDYVEEPTRRLLH